MEDMMIDDCLGHSDNEIVEFKFLGVRRKMVSGVATMDSNRETFELLREIVGSIPWELALEGLKIHEKWSLFKKHLLKAHLLKPIEPIVQQVE